MAVIKDRSEIDAKYQWNLESMYESNDAWEQDFKKVQELLPKLTAFKGRLGESAVTMLEAFKAKEELELTFENVYVYSHMRYHQNTADTFYQGLSDRASALAAEVFSALSFLAPEILALPNDKLESFLAESEELRLYEMMLKRLMREKEHVLSPEEENLLALASEVADAPSTIFSMLANADMKFGTALDSEGNEHEVSEGLYRSLMESSDRTLRKNAFEALFGTYGKYRNTLSATYNASVKKDAFYAKVKKYGSALEMALSPDNVPVDVYHNLIKTVRDNIGHLHRYVDLRKKVLNLEDLHYYDLFTPMVEEAKMPMEFEKGKALSLEALAKLGDEYVSTVQRAFDERWIDIYPNKGKRSGAYSWGTYTSNPFIMLNYNNTLDDVFTLVHELGHSMHSYFTHKEQPYVYGNYTIFVAEVASTLNENLLLHKLLSETSDKKQRMFLLNHSLDQFRATLFRQTMFAEFEQIVHEKVEKGEPLTADVMREIYGQLNEDYYGPTLVIDDELKNEWSRIPHFYGAFYVYKYATGFSAAIALANKILTEGQSAIDRYLDFLKRGSSQDPIDLLKGAGVDMSSPQPIEAALQVFKERLDELESLFTET
jgi:oligoendopeptidase F